MVAEFNDGRKRSGKIEIKKDSAKERSFAQSRRAELYDLLRDGTLEVVNELDITCAPRMFGPWFVD